MNTSIVVHHLNIDLAVAAGLGSRTEHMFPYADASSGYFKRNAEAVMLLWEARCYIPVAIKVLDAQPMTAEGLERRLDWMFEKTNSIEEAWTNAVEHNLIILPGGRVPRRSTSVGDVMAVHDNHSVRYFRVASAGFEPIGEWRRT